MAFVLFAFSSSAFAQDDHLTLAWSLIDTIDPADNVYGSPAEITWGDAPTSQTKCSSFVSELLSESYSLDIEPWMGCPSPLAATWHDGIVAGNGFDEITNINDVQPGDVIAIAYYDKGCEAMTCGSTNGSCSASGHVAIVASAPEQRSSAKSPLVDGTTQWDVEIIDSSSSYHGPYDTRKGAEADGSNDSGVGQGTMRIYTNDDGSFAGYTWSTFSSSTFYEPEDRDLVIGRIALDDETDETADAAADEAALSDGEALVDAAWELIDTIDPADNASGSPSEIYWAGDDGWDTSYNRATSSGLLSALMERALDADVSTWMGCSIPLAATWHDGIVAGNGFDEIININDVQPGDVIAIAYYDKGCADLSCGSTDGSCSSSGHVMLVSAAPAERSSAKSPLVDGTTQWDVEIIDSSSSYHGSYDTRKGAEADGSHDSGVGQGTMRIYTDDGGDFVGYTWSTFSSSTFYEPADRDLVIGRVAL